MCAKVLNSTIGQLSGKLGGMIFSRNAGGEYVRAGVTGVNPQTQAQLRARNAFASVSTLFRTLSSAEKTAWQEFADNWYSPRQGGNTGQFSAYNAFIALRSTVQQSIRLSADLNLIIDGTPATGGVTYDPFTPMPEMPLALGLAPAYASPDEQSHVLSLLSAEVFTEGTGAFVVQVGDGSGTELENMVDIYGNNLGFAVYISNGNPSDNMSYANEFSICLGFVKPFSLTTPGTQLLGVQTLGINMLNSINPGEYKRFPLKNEWVNVTVLAMNKYGMFSRLGSVETQLTV